MAMQVTDKVDAAVVNQLQDEIISLFNNNSDLAHGEILVALIQAVGNVLATIECADYRKHAVHNVQKAVKFVTADVLKKPTVQQHHLH
jgi:hypothetical protein